MELPPQLLVLLPLSVAAGLDLHLTLLAVTAAGFLGLGLPGEALLPPVVGWPVFLGLTGLYIAETTSELRPVPSLIWHTLQLLLRPLGAVLMAQLLLRGEPLVILALGASVAGVVAAFAHVLVWGQSLILRVAPDRRFPPIALHLGGDFLALALLSLTLARMDLAVLAATLLLLLGLVFGGSSHGAVRFGLTLTAENTWGIVSPARWLTGDQMPAWVMEQTPLESRGGTRGARAALGGLRWPTHFKDGWILQGNRGVLFAFRRGRRGRLLTLTDLQEEGQPGHLAKTVLCQVQEGRPSALFLQMGLIGPESHK